MLNVKRIPDLKKVPIREQYLSSTHWFAVVVHMTTTASSTTTTTTATTRTSDDTGVSNWKVSGDWFDVCKCSIPCPCEFAQTPTYGDCDGAMAYHIRNGHYGETSLDGLERVSANVLQG